MSVSLRHISGFVVLLWVVAIFYDALTAPPPLYVLGILVYAERSRTLLLFVGITLASGAALIIFKRPTHIANLIKGSVANILVFLLTLCLVMLSILHYNLSGIAYALLLGFTLVLTLYINQSLSDNFYFAVSVALACSLLAFLLYHGLPNNRWIGGIHPNLIGAFALSSVYFAARSKSSIRWLIYAIATLVAILVSSRYAIVAIFIIAIVDYISRIRLSPSRLFLATFLALIGFIMLVTASDYVLNEVLILGDHDRGLGSGLVGRTYLWETFWSQFVQHPFIGYGFRSRDAYIATHNGFLNFILENGFIAACIFAALVYASVYRSYRKYLTSRDTRQLMRVAFWSAWLVAGFFQPQIINFGDAFSLTTMFLLTDNCNDTKAGN